MNEVQLRVMIGKCGTGTISVDVSESFGFRGSEDHKVSEFQTYQYQMRTFP